MAKIDSTLDKVYKFLKSFVDENGYPPSVREICTGLSIKSTASVYYYLEKLEQKGLIGKSKSKNRAIDIFENTEMPMSKIVKAPLVGQVACGPPSLALENIESIYPLPSDLFKEDNLFMLTASGDSMIEAGIFSEDKIIVKKQNTANSGEIVVALLEDECTVKRFYQKKDYCILHPENINYKDVIVYGNLTILGIVVGLIRKF